MTDDSGRQDIQSRVGNMLALKRSATARARAILAEQIARVSDASTVPEIIAPDHALAARFGYGPAQALADALHGKFSCRLARAAERRQLIQKLSGEGLPVKAIAAEAGCSVSQVSRIRSTLKASEMLVVAKTDDSNGRRALVERMTRGGRPVQEIAEATGYTYGYVVQIRHQLRRLKKLL